MTNVTQKRLLAAAIAGISTLSAHGVAAQEKINVTVLSGYTDRTAWVRTLKEFWMPEVNKRLAASGNYELNYLEAFGTVVQPRGEFDAIGNGIGNIGLVVTAFHTDKVPLSSVSYVTPFVTVDLALTSEINDALTFSIPEMQAGWEKFNLEFVGHMGAIKSYNVLSKDPIDSLDDFEGIKVSGAGLNLRWLEGLGATGVPTALPKFYQEVNSGVSDALVGWADVVGAFKLCEVAPHFLSADMGAVSNFAMVANKTWFDGLPAEVQTAIREVTPEYRNLLAEVTTAGDANGREACVAQGGSVHEISAEMRQEWADTLPNIAKEWASAIDGTGLPGSDVLTAYMDLMRAADQPIARQWDKE
ncbi:MAG: C4-dicarboxylate TRAP transporter substrate-binding protein [Tateyamaria sp.]|uniref:C4-dicarboxylate TRAP transporter substrate-binding protein n=1 Tax=Tateyamaria sp. TaxID=1929288 RepID=UPI0032A034AC